MTEPTTPNPVPPRRFSRTGLLAGALTAVVILNGALVSALVIYEPPVDPEDSSAAGETTPGAESESMVDGLPEDYICADLDIAAFEAFAGRETNDEWAVSDGQSEYADMISEGLYCNFMVGWPVDSDRVELRVTASRELDGGTAADTLEWAQSGLESYSSGTLSDYQGPEGEGLILESTDENGHVRIDLARGNVRLEASLEGVPEGRTTQEAVSLLIELLDQIHELHELYYPDI